MKDNSAVLHLFSTIFKFKFYIVKFQDAIKLTIQSIESKNKVNKNV